MIDIFFQDNKKIGMGIVIVTITKVTKILINDNVLSTNQITITEITMPLQSHKARLPVTDD